MKRVKSACLEQTLHFILNEEKTDHETAAALVAEEVGRYKEQLEKSRVRYLILEEKKLEDDSYIIKLKKQYNRHDVGAYFD
ncbi:MAG: hypothetical protein PHI27_08495 [Eubacteriales bacterium]|nr:hypothetical protein [Eubacteriales bacterium]MDD3882277.1 hypothetical protein [Eubacteriales bacterium]MDD4512023.1 hypothetical protein [Eubacteriales bacterium]